MGNFFILIAALLLLVFVLDSLAKLKGSSKNTSENILKIYLGIIISIVVLVIPFKLWQLTGSHNTFDGMFVMAGSACAMVVFIFSFYSRRVKNHVKD
ncbi:hypothetical protein [Bacillus sp. UMB0893]|uniref:hypothetical protein n=1 Tax=Bacillus sp. UMB0893 TaxID=2066053 RepID=UPI000C785614|nr:hypothetical protein [Bacillus sp. UMB0893]PLR67202.1 hypothetical protein CYJ36_14615 [Bacillus sp. UMB0893]